MPVASVFCEHRKLRTSCALCKATAVPPASRDLKPVVEEPEPRAPRKASASRESPEATGAEGREAPEPAAGARRGPGKPLMPTRQRAKKVDNRSEAEHAEAWWVKKR